MPKNQTPIMTKESVMEAGHRAYAIHLPGVAEHALAPAGFDSCATGSCIGRLPIAAKSNSRSVAVAGLGPCFKMLIGPLLIFLLFVILFDQRGPVMQVTVFEAAMGPMMERPSLQWITTWIHRWSR